MPQDQPLDNRANRFVSQVLGVGRDGNDRVSQTNQKTKKEEMKFLPQQETQRLLEARFILQGSPRSYQDYLGLGKLDLLRMLGQPRPKMAREFLSHVLRVGEGYPWPNLSPCAGARKNRLKKGCSSPTVPLFTQNKNSQKMHKNWRK